MLALTIIIDYNEINFIEFQELRGSQKTDIGSVFNSQLRKDSWNEFFFTYVGDKKWKTFGMPDLAQDI